ncbi:MAG: DUF1330 domain-containing protein [Burkholderiales bacterium]|nr:DUF1330 domain-containing protein [Burkholderiales bacterium]
MAAYAIGSLNVHNTAWQQEYVRQMPALLAKYGGKPLCKAYPEVLEGNSLLPGFAIIVEFPTIEHARGWNDDPAHGPLRELRSSGAHFNLIVVDGM